jgi:hypothetical protein
MTWNNHGLNGSFKGYRIDRKAIPSFMQIFAMRTMCHITICETDPLYFTDSKNRRLTPRREYDSDRASVPFPFSLIWSPELLEMSGLVHDDGCKNQGLYQINPDNSQTFLPMTRLDMDKLIAEMAPAECRLLQRGKVYRWITEHCIFWGVRLGSYIGIGKPDKVKAVNRIDHNKPTMRIA